MKKISQNKVYFYLSILVTIIAILAIILGTIYGVKKKNSKISQNIEITFHSKTGKEIAKRKFKLNEKINISFSNEELELAKNEEFVGWANSLTGTLISDLKASLKNHKLYPVYRLKSPNTTKYEIKRHFEKVDESGFATESETVADAEPDKEVQLSSDKLSAPTGFELDLANSVTKQTVAADGSTIFNLYFKRKTYKVTFDFNGGMLDGQTKKEVNYKFGQNINDISKPTKTDPTGVKKYTFQGWLNQATDQLVDFTQDNSVEANINLVAKWEETDITKKVYLNLVYEGLRNSVDSENEIELSNQKKIGTLVSANDQDIKAAIADFLLSHPHPFHKISFDQAKSVSSLHVEANSVKQTIKLYFKARTYTISFNLTEDGLDQNTIDPILKQTITLKYTNSLSQDIYEKLLSIKKLSTLTKDFVLEKLIVEEFGNEFNPNTDYNANITIKPVFKEKDVFVSITPRVQSADLGKTDSPTWPVQNVKVGEVFNFTPNTNIKYEYKFLGWTDKEGGSIKNILITRQTKEVFAVLAPEERADYQVIHYLEKQGESSTLDGQYDEIIENKNNQLVKDKANYTPYSGPDKDIYEIDDTKPAKLVVDLVPGSTDTKVYRYYRLKTTRVNFVADSGIQSISPASALVKRTRLIGLPNYAVKDTHNFLGWSNAQNGAIQTKFIATGETQSIYAVTDYQNREITYTIRKEQPNGTFLETEEKKTGKIATTHTVSYQNPDTTVYHEPTYSVEKLTVNADKALNKVTVTILRKVYTVNFEARNYPTTLAGRNVKHGAAIGEIDYPIINEQGFIIRELHLDGKEMPKADIEMFVIVKEHKVTVYFGKPANKLGKYPQTRVENPVGIHKIEDKTHKLEFNSKGKDYTMEFTRSYWQDANGVKYEKLNGKYFQLETVWFFKISEQNTWFTEKILDFSPFNIFYTGYQDNSKPERSIFKALVNDIGEVLGHEVHMPTYDDGDFSVKQALDNGKKAELKKESTDFARAVLGNYTGFGKYYRNVDFTHFTEPDYQSPYFDDSRHQWWWLGTEFPRSNPSAQSIVNGGDLDWNNVHAVLGVVVCARF